MHKLTKKGEFLPQDDRFVRQFGQNALPAAPRLAKAAQLSQMKSRSR
jgi:hypothetical protein